MVVDGEVSLWLEQRVWREAIKRVDWRWLRRDQTILDL
jgi:hypothetical protein